jgi:2-methylcitrate dehydratase PrpD
VAVDEPRDQPWITDVSFKPWPACRHAHPALDALHEALQAAAAGPQRQESAATNIEHIDVFSYADATRFCDRPQPVDEAQARFSIQHAVAAWVLWGPAQLHHYQAAALLDEQVQDLRARVRLSVDAEIESRYPQHFGARVVLRWRDGAQHVAELRDTLGDPARPLSEAALTEKACMLMEAAGWRPRRIDAALAACAGLPDAPDLSELREVLLA